MKSCVFLAILGLAAQAMAADDMSADMPDRPGVVRVERRDVSPEKRARDALPGLDVAVGGGGRFSRRGKDAATFAFSHEPGSVLGRLELVRIDGATTATAMRVFLHGQGGESCEIPPGRYRLRAAFWVTGERPPAAYPSDGEFQVRRGQTATLTFDRDDMRAIKKWLRALAK